MKKVLALALAVALMGMASTNVSAQVPNVQVYFDDIAHTSKDCAGIGVMDTLLVVANNFNIWMNAIEFSIQYPPSLQWFGDILPPNVLKIGTTPAGLAISYTTPQNAFGPLVVTQVQVMWQCDACGASPEPVVVLPNPISGQLRAVRWPDDQVVPGVGMTSLVCPGVVPVEETTWGQVKALYNN